MTPLLFSCFVKRLESATILSVNKDNNFAFLTSSIPRLNSNQAYKYIDPWLSAQGKPTLLEMWNGDTTINTVRSYSSKYPSELPSIEEFRFGGCFCNPQGTCWIVRGVFAYLHSEFPCVSRWFVCSVVCVFAMGPTYLILRQATDK